jgi:hypothetical protein
MRKHRSFLPLEACHQADALPLVVNLSVVEYVHIYSPGVLHISNIFHMHIIKYNVQMYNDVSTETVISLTHGTVMLHEKHAVHFG